MSKESTATKIANTKKKLEEAMKMVEAMELEENILDTFRGINDIKRWRKRGRLIWDRSAEQADVTSNSSKKLNPKKSSKNMDSEKPAHRDRGTGSNIEDEELEETMKMVEAMVENSAGIKVVMDVGNNTLKINCSILEFEIVKPDTSGISGNITPDSVASKLENSMKQHFLSNQYIVFGIHGPAVAAMFNNMITHSFLTGNENAQAFQSSLIKIINKHKLIGGFGKIETESTKQYHRYELIGAPKYASLNPKNKIKDLVPLEFDSNSTYKRSQIQGFIGEIEHALSST